MEPVRRNFFSPNEIDWLKTDWLEEFCNLDGKRRASIEPEVNPADRRRSGVTQTQDFLRRVTEAFAEAFPYRHPNSAKKKDIDPVLRKLRMSDTEWPLLGEKIKNWLQKQKPEEFKHRKRASQRSDRDTKRTKAPATKHSVTHYTIDPSDLKNAKRALNGLLAEMERPWSAIKPAELAKRQRALPGDLEDVVQMFARTAGVELYVIGVWRDDHHTNTIEVASDRSKSFLNRLIADEARNAFVGHVKYTLGPSLSCSIDSAAETVYGDDDNSFRPILPSSAHSPAHRAHVLELYCKALWQWQGGRHYPPWRLLEEDGESGTCALIERARMPEGVDALYYPHDMTELQSEVWFNHILAGQRGDLPQNNIFQFQQPRPRQYELALRTTIHPDATLHYTPESHAYALRQKYHPTHRPIDERADGLPIITPNSLYISLTSAQQARLKAQVGEKDSCHRLIEQLIEHDQLGPHHLCESLWPEKATECPHLRPGQPKGDAAISGFVTEGGFLPASFYDPGDTSHLQWSLASCLQWVQPRNWIHDPSGTLEGGPCGVKWAVLLLTHIRINVLTCERGDAPRPAYYDRVRPDFSDREIAQLEAAVQSLKDALQRSSKGLLNTMAERQDGNPGLEGQAAAMDELSLLDDVQNFEAPEPEDEWTLEGIEPQVCQPGPSPEAHRRVPAQKKRTASGDFSRPKKARGHSAEGDLSTGDSDAGARGGESVSAVGSEAEAEAEAETEVVQELESEPTPETEKPVTPPRRTRSQTSAKPRVSFETEEEDEEEDEIEATPVKPRRSGRK